MSNALKTASVLAFERKLDPSDAVFHAGNWEDLAKSASWPPVRLREKSVRGTISNRLKAKDQDPAKLDAAIENPNLQTVDVATLPSDADTLKVQFTLRVLPGTARRPHATARNIRPNSCRPCSLTSRSTAMPNWPTAMRPTWPMAASCGATGSVRNMCAWRWRGSRTARLSSNGASMPWRRICARWTR